MKSSSKTFKISFRLMIVKVNSSNWTIMEKKRLNQKLVLFNENETSINIETTYIAGGKLKANTNPEIKKRTSDFFLYRYWRHQVHILTRAPASKNQTSTPSGEH
jgi:hypothetical protein